MRFMFIGIYFLIQINNHLFSQELKLYNDNLNFKIIDNTDFIEHDGSLRALIIIFNNDFNENTIKSISENVQLKEIQLINPNQAIIDTISKLNLGSLTHLFIENYKHHELKLNSFPLIEHLYIKSEKLTSLLMKNSQFDNLYILDLDLENLTHWETENELPSLGLLNLKASKLSYFPIKSMPNIGQFLFYCSFDEFPSNLCNYKDLIYMSFNNYKPITIEKCLVKKIKNGVYSDITIYENLEGKTVEKIVSKDY